jgi:hypothetical protein
MPGETGLDLLVGAPAISQFVFGTKKRARSIYQPKLRKQLGLFLLNGQVCGRPSRIIQRVAAEEGAVETVAESTTT